VRFHFEGNLLQNTVCSACSVPCYMLWDAWKWDICVEKWRHFKWHNCPMRLLPFAPWKCHGTQIIFKHCLVSLSPWKSFCRRLSYTRSEQNNIFRRQNDVTCCSQGCGVGIARNRKFLGGVGFLRALEVQLIHFLHHSPKLGVLTRACWTFQHFNLKWYNFFWNFY